MDVVLDRKPFGLSASSYNASPELVNTAEHLLAFDFSELIAEVRQLQRRRINKVSVRRQRALRIGPALLKDVLNDAGMEVCTVGFAGGFTGSLNRTYDQAVDDTRRALEFAADLEARAVAVLPGCRGLHARNHIARTVQAGVEACLDDALRFRVDMLLPLNSFLGRNRDVYQPTDQSILDWVESFDSHRIQSMMMLRGKRLPDNWERCLERGGMLRISGRLRSTVGSHNVVKHMLAKLNNAAVPVG